MPLAPRVQRHFPALTDDRAITDVLEEVGASTAAKPEGPLDDTWVVVQRTAALQLRHDEWPIGSATLARAASDRALRGLPARFVTSEQIYHEILYQLLELIGYVPPVEYERATMSRLRQPDSHNSLSDDPGTIQSKRGRISG